MLDQQTDNTETSNQTDISRASRRTRSKNQIKDWRDLSKSNKKR